MRSQPGASGGRACSGHLGGVTSEVNRAGYPAARGSGGGCRVPAVAQRGKGIQALSIQLGYPGSIVDVASEMRTYLVSRKK